MIGSPYSQSNQSDTQNNDELLRAINELEIEVAALKGKMNIDLQTGVEVLDTAKGALFDNFIETLWNKVFYVSTMDGPAVETTSASEKFDITSRQGDTGSGKYLSIEMQSRFRCHFYFNGTDSLDATAYIGTCGTATTGSPGSAINAATIEYCALKISNGAVSIATKNLDGITTKATQERIVDDTTYKLEIVFNPRSNVSFYLNDKFLGASSTNVPGNLDAVTFFPLMVSIKRGAAVNRKVTIESWEFIQERKFINA